MSIYIDGKSITSSTSEVTIATGRITVTGMEHTVESESGTTDTLDAIDLDATLSASLDGRGFLLLLNAKVGDTITITHTSGGSANAIKLTDGRNYSMTNDTPLLLRYNPATTQFAAIGGVTLPSGTIVTETGAATLTNKNLTAPVITNPEVTEKVSMYSGAGAISTNYGIALLTGGSATTYTLADPTAGADDGQILRIMSTTAQAHKVDNSAGSGFNVGGAGADTLTFGGAIGDCATLLAYNGDWYVLNLRNVTITAS